MWVAAVMDKLNNTVAAGAVVSPWWMPNLEAASQTAALLLPICGVVWILIQVYYKIRKGG